MTAKTVTMSVIVASGLSMLGAPDAGADVTSPLQALVDAATQRLQTADPVAASKFRTSEQVDDPQLEHQVIDAVTADATSARVDAGYVHDVFRRQIDATDSVGHSRFAQWKLDPVCSGVRPRPVGITGHHRQARSHHRRRDRQALSHAAFTVVPCRPPRRGAGKEFGAIARLACNSTRHFLDVAATVR